MGAEDAEQGAVGWLRKRRRRKRRSAMRLQS